MPSVTAIQVESSGMTVLVAFDGSATYLTGRIQFTAPNDPTRHLWTEGPPIADDTTALHQYRLGQKQMILEAAVDGAVTSLVPAGFVSGQAEATPVVLDSSSQSSLSLTPVGPGAHPSMIRAVRRQARIRSQAKRRKRA